MNNDNLPPLPEGEEAGMLRGGAIVYTADQVRQAQRDAVAASGAGVPDGWRLVPIEPTHGMIRAAECGKGASTGKTMESPSIIYADMLAAAPIPDRAAGAPEGSFK